MSNWGIYLYFGGSFLSALIVTGFTVYAWRHRHAPSASAFARLLTCGAVMLWGSPLRFIASPDFFWARFGFFLAMLSAILTPPFWLFFALDYSDLIHRLTRRHVLALNSIPALSLVLYLSNSLHHGFFQSLTFEPSRSLGTIIGMVYGPWFYVHSFYSYALMLAGAVLLIRSALHTFRLYRFQALLLVLGACGVLIPNILATFRLTQFSYTFVGFLLMTFLYGQAIFRYRLLNLAPVARHTLVDTMSDGMVVVDDQETIVDLNPAMAQFLNVTTQPAVGCPVWDFLPAGAGWEAWLRDPAGAQATLTHAGPAGARAYDLRVTLLHDRWGRISGRLAVLRDITERQQAAEALERYALELESRNAELDAFAHTVAHDLKSPLSAVVGFGTYLTSRYENTDDAQRLTMLNTISRQGQRMARIIDELLLLASLRRQDSVPLGRLDMAAIAAEVLERLALTIEEKQACLTLPETWPAALGYAAWVEEIWANYLSNALKYGGSPPCVTLGYTRLAAGLSPVAGEITALFSTIPNPHAKIAFWVRDNGAGLAPEEQARLFTPFTRLDQVSAKGHGLGLSIVQRISQKLGGEVGVVSAPGAGSTFWFTLSAPDETL